MRVISSHEMRVLVLSFALVATVAPGAAHADDTERAALVHLDRGVAAFRAGDYERAHRELLAAHELAPDKPNPYRWLALTEIQLGDCASALGHIDGFLARVRAGDPRIAEMTRWRDLCRRTGVLRVDTTPAAATLRIDGALVGTAPYRSLSMREGAHTIVAEKRGHRPVTREITLEAGGELDLHLELPVERTPITKRWWFWPAVGAAVATTAAVILVAADRSPAELPPIRCDDTGCRP